jgi:hypothetical protein
MASLVDDLHHAAKLLDDAHGLTKNAVVLLDRISRPITEDALGALQLLEETCHRTRRAAETLEPL